jgi:hypothetical protein
MGGDDGRYGWLGLPRETERLQPSSPSLCRPAIRSDSSAILEPTERQRIGDEINAAFIFGRANQRKEPQVVRRK